MRRMFNDLSESVIASGRTRLPSCRHSACGGTIRVPDDQPTIQAGINTATDGDTVLVSPGTYQENINFLGTKILVTSHFEIDRDSKVVLRIFDLRGREVKTLVDREMPAGTHSIHWDGTNNRSRRVSSGIFVYRLQVAGETFNRKMVLVK